MTPIMYHIAVHMMTGQFLVIKGNIAEPETWEIMGGFNTLHDAEADIIEWEEGAEDDSRTLR